MVINKVALIDAISLKLRHKLDSVEFKPSNMPFQTNLMGKQRVFSYSLMHSISTTLGDFHRDVACAIAEEQFDHVQAEVAISSPISEQALQVVDDIIIGISNSEWKSNTEEELELLRDVCRKGELKEVKTPKVDVLLEKGETIYMIELKTAKPNKGLWESMKRQLLTWSAQYLNTFPEADVYPLVGIPYNPYSPNPYSYATLNGMLDIEGSRKQVLVADELWDFMSGTEDTLMEILDCYEEVGATMSDEITMAFENLVEKNASQATR